jgi:hypothetical protein
MRRFLILSALLLAALPARARTIEVSLGGTYPNLEAAAAVAVPGDTIMFHAGIYPGGEYVENLQGSVDKWITITGEFGDNVTIRGGTNAWQLTDPAYVRIQNFKFEGQTGNGLNIDDGGSPETPAHHVIIEVCNWPSINATGNNDMLKISGLDSFTIRSCTFYNGSPGGSLIDMVGCHNGMITENHFENGGSNSIQAKGGTRYIRIERNFFVDGGLRTINIGGSTGIPYFRPIDANYEASDILVYSNHFLRSQAPIAYVGAVHCHVVNNTIYGPEKWAIRILQETTDARFLQCGDNSFVNNIVYVTNAAASPTINIGPNTRPETFTFRNNLWYNESNPNWPGPNLPAPETGGIIGSDPMFVGGIAFGRNVSLLPGSPAIGAGYPVAEPLLDYYGYPFSTPRSIGAIEGSNPPVSVDPISPIPSSSLQLLPNPSPGDAVAHFTLAAAEQVEVALWDVEGGMVRLLHSGRLTAGAHGIPLAGVQLPPGVYLLRLRRAQGTETLRAVVVR